MTDVANLPPLYAAWIDELLSGDVPAESNATCSDCAMVASLDGGGPGYSADVKCCTFLPQLWNFLVGGVLLDDGPETARGRATVEARIDRGVEVTALGLGRDAEYQQLYDGGTAPFGRSRDLLCPHYLPENGGLCGIWRHREATCTTFYCKFVRGAVGADFWAQLRELLRAIEASVATWCLTELGGATTGDWGNWRGRERDFYRQCARLASGLTWADVARIGGARVAVCADSTKAAYERLLSDAIPEHPMFALVQITPRGANRARLATYSGLDALEVPAIVAKILPYFDGRPTADALANIRRDEGVDFDPSMVRKLTDFEVLKERASVT